MRVGVVEPRGVGFGEVLKVKPGKRQRRGMTRPDGRGDGGRGILMSPRSVSQERRERGRERCAG